MADQPDLFEKTPVMTPGASRVPINPNFGASGNHSPLVRNGSRPAANAGNGKPTTYERLTDGREVPATIADVDTDRNWFTPFQPVTPFGPPFVNYPRTWDYGVGVNIDFLPPRVALFDQLRGMSQSWGILRAVIETRKDQLMRIPWDIRLRDNPKKTNKNVAAIKEFFKRPDGKRRFDPWMRSLLEDRFVIDAASLYVWRSLGGAPLAVDVIDGATIKPLVDDAGRRPDYPSPAYQQIVKGMPMIDLDETELIYAPARPRPYMPIYGYSEVEQIMLEVIQGIRKTIYNTAYWNEGTIPDLIVTVPEGWTPQQTASFQAMFDALMSGNLAFKSKVRFMPGGMKPFDMKNANGEALKTEQDEWLTRLVCFVFAVSAQPFVKQMNRATAETAADEAMQEGLHPLMAWVKSEIMDPLIQEKIGFGFDEVEFAWLPEPEVDEQKRMTVLTGYVKAGIQTVNEVRDVIALPPMQGGDELIVETATGPVPLKETVEANRQAALAKPDELDRQQETHDVTIQGQKADQKAAAKAPPGKKGVGKSADAPFVFKRGKRYRRLAPITPTRPLVMKAADRGAKAIYPILKKAGAQAAKQIREYSKVAKERSLNKRTEDILAALQFDGLTGILDVIQPELEAVARDAAAQVVAGVGLSGDEKIVDVVNERAVTYARDRAAELVGMRYNADGELVEAKRAEYRIDESTREMLRADISNGLEDNIGLDEIADTIAENYAFSEERAMTIAYTEVSDANSQASLESYRVAQGAGVEMLKEWLTADEPCPICIENEDAGPIPIDDDFPSGDDAPTAHPWCYCALGVVVNEDSLEEMAKARGFMCEPVWADTVSKAPKTSKDEAGYVDKSPRPDHCSVCTMFKRGRGSSGQCTAVAGTINADGWCTFFEAKK